jgi:hypothetical protein
MTFSWGVRIGDHPSRVHLTAGAFAVKREAGKADKEGSQG